MPRGAFPDDPKGPLQLTIGVKLPDARPPPPSSLSFSPGELEGKFNPVSFPPNVPKACLL